tara:strand:- start:10377 stop:11876 length:1500 start_codon:yes stop_codon:yes gene_type:complete
MDTQQQIKWPEESTLIPLADIKLDNRSRKEFGDIQELADSIQLLGLLNPPVLSRTDNNLIGGERRVRALQLLGLKEIPVLFREEMSESKLRSLELHENIARLDMSWQEQVLLIEQVHSAKTLEQAELNREWFQFETGKLFGRSAAHVSNALKIAYLLLSGDDDILGCATITEAVTIMLKRAEKEAMAERVRRLGGKPQEVPPANTDTVTFVDLDNIDSMPNREDTPRQSTVPEVSSKKNAVIDLSEYCIHGDCIAVMKSMKAGCVDHVVTDIPYGIDMDNLDVKDLETVEETHQVEQNIAMMPQFLKQAYRMLGQKGGYCIFWYDLDHHEKLQSWAEDVGFKVQRWPIVWNKASACKNNAPQFNFTKASEVAMVLRRGSKTVLNSPQTKNFITCDGSLERKLYSNPFAKPAAVWKFILDAIAFDGQKILDPFAGQMSMARVALNSGLKPISIELNAGHFARGVDNYKTIISEILNNQVDFINDPRVGLDLEGGQDAEVK